MIMKGYYTVGLVGEGVSTAERIVLETRFAAMLEAHVGGRERTVSLVLAAADDPASREALQLACQKIEAALWTDHPRGRFAVRAWAAIDL